MVVNTGGSLVVDNLSSPSVVDKSSEGVVVNESDEVVVKSGHEKSTELVSDPVVVSSTGVKELAQIGISDVGGFDEEISSEDRVVVNIGGS